MLSKCANPECSEIFRYLHEGKVFYLAPTPEVLIATGMQDPSLHERFWLCDRCSKEMTLVWAGTQVKLVSKPAPTKPKDALPQPPAPATHWPRGRLRGRAALAGRGDG